MIKLLLLSLIAVLVGITGALFWLLRQHIKLKRSCDELTRAINRNSEDIAGICSAAVMVDSLVQGNSEQIKAVTAKLAEYLQQEAQMPDASAAKLTEDREQGTRGQNSAQTYHKAIKKIHQGATADELVKEFGLSREEAMLLVRLNTK